MEGTRISRIIVLLLNAFVLANSADMDAIARRDTLLAQYNQQWSSIERTPENNQILLDAEFKRNRYRNYNYYDILSSRYASFNGVKWHPDCILIHLGYRFNSQNEFGLPHFTLPPTMQFFTSECTFTWCQFFDLFRYFDRNHMYERGLRNINIRDHDLSIARPTTWVYPIPQNTDNIPSVSDPIQLSTVGCLQLPWLVGRALIELMNQGKLKCPRIERIVVTNIPPSDIHILEQELNYDLWKEFTKKSYSEHIHGTYTPKTEIYMVIQRKQQFGDYVPAERLSLTFNRDSQERQCVRNLYCALGRESAKQYLSGDLKQMVLFDYAKDRDDIAYNQYLLDLMGSLIQWHTDSYDFFGYAISSLRGVRAPMKSLSVRAVPHLLPELSLMVFPSTFDTLRLFFMKLTWEDLIAIFAHGRIPDLASLQITKCGTFGDQQIPIQVRLPRVQELVTNWNTFLTLLQNNVVSPTTQVQRCEIDTWMHEDELSNQQNLENIRRVFPEQHYQFKIFNSRIEIAPTQTTVGTCSIC